MADPKVGTGKKPKMLKKALLKLNELKNHMLAKFKS